jgi:hypothetical protein
VHGTWISGKKAEPGIPVELKEGDTVRVGGSSRVYRLHWVPLSRAYDLENPFVPPTLDVYMTEEKEEENTLETYQVRDLFFNSKSCRVPTSYLFVEIVLDFGFCFLSDFWGLGSGTCVNRK